jgi:putative membrane protein
MGVKLCWAVFVLWFAVSLWSFLEPASGGALLLAQLLLLLFVAMHGSLSYGWRGTVVYAVIAGGVSMLLEITSVNFGFPFGFYTHHTPGQLLGVPLIIPLVYATLGWAPWVMARVIVRDRPAATGGASARFITPVVAAFILTFYDFPSDPVAATIAHAFTYRHPGGYFGVPLTNYLGWLLNGFVFYQLFALVEDRFAPPNRAALNPPGYWLMPCLVTVTPVLRFVIAYLGAPEGTASVEGRTFLISDIYESGIIASLMTVVFATLIAVVRIYSVKPTLLDGSAPR